MHAMTTCIVSAIVRPRKAPMHVSKNNCPTFLLWHVQSWNQVKMQVRVSSLQWSILNGVRNAGFKVHPEYDDGIFSIDMAVFLPHPNGEPIKVLNPKDDLHPLNMLLEILEMRRLQHRARESIKMSACFEE